VYPENKETLSRAEAAAFLDIGKSSLDKIKDLPRIKIGRRTIYRRLVLINWLSEHETVKGGQS
jgi:hypothetical protein